ncbi:MAG: ABC transporter ATP-binding protein [Chlamydiota bacterium]
MILLAKDLYKSYKSPQKVTVLKGISLSLERGESVAICGRSGEGKTTLLHILGTLEAPDSGSIEIGGESSFALSSARLRNRHIGFVFQAYNLLEDFTTLQNVLMPALIARQRVDREKGLSLLRKVGLEDRADFPVKFLSGGERQRAAIARCLCNDPDLILADEPSGNLDRGNSLKIGELLFSLVKEEKKSLVLVTHDFELAALCDRRYLLLEGRLVLQ